MRHGWKIRIEERRYFEEKKEQREQIRIIRQMEMRHLKQEIDRMKRDHETH